MVLLSKSKGRRKEKNKTKQDGLKKVSSVGFAPAFILNISFCLLHFVTVMNNRHSSENQPHNNARRR